MKEKMKKILKNRIFIFALGLCIAGSVSVAAETFFPSNDVTYDNTESGLTSTNVQGAIDELYNTCFPPKAGDTIIDSVDIVTSGDGLYKDEYEEGKYTYKGKNPNNYITFNGEKAGWRIISIDTEETIKIMKIESIGNQTWHSSLNSDWSSPTSLNTYLNNTYYNKLNSTDQSYIVAKYFSIGEVGTNDTNLDEQINNENSKKWEGKIALPTMSEYIRTNSNKSGCETLSNYNKNYSSCKNTTWMYSSNYDWWLLSPKTSYDAYLITSRGSFGSSTAGGIYGTSAGVRPVLYLSSDIKIIGGDGSQSNPYQISL